MRLYVLSRHAQSTLNLENRVNGDPSVAAPLTAAGREQAIQLGHQLAELPLDLCVHTRFERTVETAELALDGRDVPRSSEPLLDDVKVGELEGRDDRDVPRLEASTFASRPVPRRREPRRRRAPLRRRVAPAARAPRTRGAGGVP